MMRYGILLIALAMFGCATTAVSPARYVLVPQVEVKAFPAIDKTLGVRAIEAARPYRQKIAYLESDYTLGQYEFSEWAELPRDAVMRALTDAIIATGHFKDVGNAGDLDRPDYILTGALRRFEEVRTGETWTAVCEVRLELRESEGKNALWAATLTATQPLEENAVAALPAAMSKAVAAIAKEAAENIAAH